jgi:hypothetical protein
MFIVVWLDQANMPALFDVLIFRYELALPSGFGAFAASLRAAIIQMV